MKSEVDKMIDDFLRESLGNYSEQPRPTVWQGIVQKLPYKPFGKYFPGSNGGIIATLIGGIIVTAGLFYFFAGNTDSKASKESNKNMTTTESVRPTARTSVDNKLVNSSQSSAENTETYTSSTENNGAGQNQTSSADTHSKLLKSKAQKARNSNTVNVIPEPRLVARTDKKDVAPEGVPPLLSEIIVIMTPKPALLLAGINKGFYFNDFRNENSRNLSWLNQKQQTEYFPSRGTYCLTAFYRPEFLKGAASDIHAATRNTEGLSLRYVKNGFVMETGLEHSRESRNQDYNVQYFDFLGTYQNLDSISFIHQGNQVVPEYHYTTDSVFSPELSAKKVNSQATYSFVRIPVLIGMERQFGHFSLGLKGGVMFGILVSQSGTLFHSFNPDARIYSLENNSPTYKNTNLQWVLKADVDWNITPSFGLNLAPAINGYLTDPYNRSKSAVDPPVYWGIQGGIFYKW